MLLYQIRPSGHMLPGSDEIHDYARHGIISPKDSYPPGSDGIPSRLFIQNIQFNNTTTD